MTNHPSTIRVILSDSGRGIWRQERSGVVVATGLCIPENRDYWYIAEGLQSAVNHTWLSLDGLTIECVDPSGADLFGSPIEGGEVICSFRIVDGKAIPSVSR